MDRAILEFFAVAVAGIPFKAGKWLTFPEVPRKKELALLKRNNGQHSNKSRSRAASVYNATGWI